jgi:hypothetical protein
MTDTRERPILFSGPLIQPIMADIKTQTRRLVNEHDLARLGVDRAQDLYAARMWPNVRPDGAAIKFPPDLARYGQPGDRLWVRETWYCDNTTAPNWNPGKRIEATPELIAEWRESLYYRADAKTGTCCELIPECACSEFGGRSPWRPSIHMPRWASRLTLEVIRVRIERLHAITEDDAKAEGVRPFFERFPEISRDQRLTTRELARDSEYRASFAVLWDEINGERALWITNPLVRVVEFKRIADAQAKAAA